MLSADTCRKKTRQVMSPHLPTTSRSIPKFRNIRYQVHTCSCVSIIDIQERELDQIRIEPKNEIGDGKPPWGCWVSKVRVETVKLRVYERRVTPMWSSMLELTTTIQPVFKVPCWLRDSHIQLRICLTDGDTSTFV